MRRLSLAFLLAFGATAALADLPRAVDNELSQRFAANPRAFDVTDLFCENRGIDEACEVPGGVLDGGGPGVCQRRMDAPRRYIELVCTTPRLPPIDRQMPADVWQADAKACATPTLRALLDKRPGWRCDASPVMASDRFCADLADGARCEVDVPGQTVRHPGVCKSLPVTADQWMDGMRWRLTRTQRMCMAEVPVVHSPHRIPVSPWRKLLQ